MFKRLLSKNPIDIFDKGSERIYSIFSAIPKRRKLVFEDYLKEIRSDYSSDKTPQLIIAIDDLSSLGLNKDELDMGGNENGEIIKSFDHLLKNKLKITAFTIPNPCFKKSSENISNYFKRENFKLSDSIINWSLENKIEIAQHGYKHIRTGRRGYARSMEFEWKDYETINQEIIQGHKLILKNQVQINGFKPPAWSIGQLNGKYELINAILKLNLFSYCSLSSPNNGLNYKNYSASHIHIKRIERNKKSIKNIPQNISIISPLEQSKELINIICEKGGIVSIQSHACLNPKIIADGLSLSHCERIIELSDYAISQGAKIIFAREAI
tara:strand:- start:1456 stop:2433 length:978 start_codon:yes stop_codon:yes gene_type:complete